MSICVSVRRCISIKGRAFLQRTSRSMSTSVSAGGDHLDRTAAKPRLQVITQAEVTEMKDLSGTVKLLKLRVENSNFSFRAGQWVDMFIPGVETVGGFSMSSPPHVLTESGLLHLAVKFSKHPPALWVHTKCQVGSKVRMRVGGDFFYSPGPDTGRRDLLLLAGGVGVNPLYSMLQHFAFCQGKEGSSGDQGRSAYMLYSARNATELIFQDELINLARSTRNVHLKLFSSREKTTHSEFMSEGRIQACDVHSALSNLDMNRTDVYLCGPLPFIEDMTSHCTVAGVPSENVHYERWW